MALGIGGGQRRTFLIPFRLLFGLRGNGERGRKEFFVAAGLSKISKRWSGQTFILKNEGFCGGRSSGS